MQIQGINSVSFLPDDKRPMDARLLEDKTISAEENLRKQIPLQGNSLRIKSIGLLNSKKCSRGFTNARRSSRASVPQEWNVLFPVAESMGLLIAQVVT